MPRWIKGVIVGVVVGLTGLVLSISPVGTHFEQNVGLSWLFKFRGAIEPPPNVVVVAINKRAIEGLELAPHPRDWPRSIHARLINSLMEQGAEAIVFDMDFQRPKEPADDQMFADAITKSGRVILFERLEGKRQLVVDTNGKASGTVWVEESIPPIPALANAAKAIAPFPVPKVQVNIFRFWTFKPSAGGSATMPSVALQVYALKAYSQWLEILRGEVPTLGQQFLPQKADQVSASNIRNLMQITRYAFIADPGLYGRLMEQLSSEPFNSSDKAILSALLRLYHHGDNPYLNFYGPPGTIPTIPYNAVVGINKQNIDPAELDFTDKVVFIGFSDLYDPGQPDRFYTAFTNKQGVDLSGVEIAATAFANLLTERTLQQSSAIGTTAILSIVGFVLGITIYLLPAIVGLPVALLLSALYIYVVYFVFVSSDQWLPLATPILVQLPMALFIGLFGQYLLERHKEKLVSKAINYYLPDNVAQQIVHEQLDPSALNKVVYGICLATDMSGFTTISETMSPDKLAKFMNSYFDTLATAINKYEVNVTEFHADTIMCAWTANDATILDRHKPALASLAVVESVKLFNQENEKVNLNARIGMDEGNFYLGHTGGGGRMGYSILGDCANTAARLESLNKHLGTHILAAESIVADLNGFLLRPLGRFALVGKKDPTGVVEILGKQSIGGNDETQLLQYFSDALQLFHEEKWHEAEDQFTLTLEHHPGDGPSRFYLQLCRSYQQKAPAFDNPSVVHMGAK